MYIFDSVRVRDVDCVVRGSGPRPQKVFVYGYPACSVSSDGFQPILRRAKRKRAMILESSDIGSSDDLGDVGSLLLVVPMLIIVWLMITILPVMKTVRPSILLLMMSTALVTILLAVMPVTAVLRITALPV